MFPRRLWEQDHKLPLDGTVGHAFACRLSRFYPPMKNAVGRPSPVLQNLGHSQSSVLLSLPLADGVGSGRFWAWCQWRLSLLRPSAAGGVSRGQRPRGKSRALGGDVTIGTGADGRPRSCVRFPRPAPFADRDVPLIKDLDNLSKLSLANTQVTDAGLADLVECRDLLDLDLSDTQVTDAGLKEVAKLRQLQGLVLTNTNVTDNGLKALKPLTRLCRLSLCNPQITDRAADAIIQLGDLRELNFSKRNSRPMAWRS